MIAAALVSQMNTDWSAEKCSYCIDVSADMRYSAKYKVSISTIKI